MQLHGFLSEKLPRKKRKDKKRVISEWTDTTGPGPLSSLSRSSMYYITLTLYNPNKPAEYR